MTREELGYYISNRTGHLWNFESQWEVWLPCGKDLLEIPPVKHNIGPCRRNPLIDAITVKPLVGTQLGELAVTGVLNSLKPKLLRLLKAKIFIKRKEYWYKICPATFVVLQNPKPILNEVVGFARRFCTTVGFPSPFVDDTANQTSLQAEHCSKSR